MIPERPCRIALFAAVAACALALRAAPAMAIDNDEPKTEPCPPVSTEVQSGETKATTKTDVKSKETKTTAADKECADKTKDNEKAGETKTDKKSELQFRNGYRHAHDLIYRQHDYVAGIAALRALHHDDQPDVATLLGYSSRKLGRYAEAKYWYDKALTADPRHVTTLSYMGMWHAEQGNRLKARDYLEKVRLICGTECKAFRELKHVIAHSATY